MFKIALNAGHGINTAGKRCLKAIDKNETREWTLNSRICNKIQEKLKAYSGYELIRLDDTTGKTDVALKTRTDKANKFGADFYLAIHHNAGVSGGSGGGVIAIVYTTVKDGSVTTQWQKDLYNAIIAKTGLKGNRSVPLQKQDLHEVRESKMPSVLLECGFMDSTKDTPIILTDKFAEEVADACVEVIVKRGGLKKINSTTPNNTQTAKTTTAATKVATKPAPAAPAKKTVDQIADEVVAGKWGNGDDRKKKLQNAGYDYSAVQKKVNEKLKKKTTPSPAPVKKPATPTIKVGSTVKVQSGAKDMNNGKKIALFALARKYKVKSLNGKKAVLTYNGAIFAAISTDDLELV